MNNENKVPNPEFTPKNYKELLCVYLQALGDDLLLSEDYESMRKGSYVLSIRKRLVSNLKLTKRQNRYLSLIEKHLADEIKNNPQILNVKADNV